MLTIGKATTADCELIHKTCMADISETYKEILSPSKTIMMEWMYSIENIRKQMEEEGHVYFIGYKDKRTCVVMYLCNNKEDLFHLQKIYVLPSFQGFCGSFLFHEAVKIYQGSAS